MEQAKAKRTGRILASALIFGKPSGASVVENTLQTESTARKEAPGIRFSSTLSSALAWIGALEGGSSGQSLNAVKRVI
jgi:hypothetical protein